MSILQSNENELRYSKRQNLEQEATVIGNYYRDIIRSYGIDCRYFKLNTSQFENFKNIVDQNVILQKAYGQIMNPDYSISANMLTYMEIENDIFQINKLGNFSNADVNFYFDSKDFACALATKLGQYQEYKIKEKEFECEVPEYPVVPKYTFSPTKQNKYIDKTPNLNVFPYKLGLGYAEIYECELLSGRISVDIDGYELDKETTVICHPYEHSDFAIDFSANDDLYKSFKYKIVNDDYLEQLVFLTYTVKRVNLGNDDYKYILHGKIHGGVLFYNLYKIGKYIDLIHPEVGDVISIDFPDEKNREQYEITDCFDKQLTQDGINPLLHKYIWKCKAKRYVNSYEDIEQNDANDKVEEKLKYDSEVNEAIASKISYYPDKEDAAYGGYDGKSEHYDNNIPNAKNVESYEYLEDPTCLDIIKFATGSKLVTNGYDLIFVNAQNEGFIVSKLNHDQIVHKAMFESNLKWLKATDNEIVFVDIEGNANKLAENEEATQNELELCLNSLFDKTVYSGATINNNDDNFVKFNGCKSLLWATSNNLFARLASNGKVFKLV